MRLLNIILILFVFNSCAVKVPVEYNTNQTLQKFCEVLNEVSPQYKTIVDGGFGITENGVPYGFTVYDLNDPSNFSKRTPIDTIENIKFKNGHFYHFVPVIMSMSYSNIAYFEDNEIKIFKSINCLNKGDSYDDFIMFAKKKLNDKKDVLQNLKNYREFGEYLIEDNYGMKVDCDCAPCE